MFNARNMRVFLIVSVALYLLFSSANMAPARSFLGDIVNHSKRQMQMCPILFSDVCWEHKDCISEEFNCNCKLKGFFYIGFRI